MYSFSLRIDCAGILKLRNSDIELRKGETDIGRKNTRVRLVFRVHINQPNGRTVSLQASSNPIECCKSHMIYNKSKRWIIIFFIVLQETQRRGVMSCWIALNSPSPVALALHNQMAIDALYLMPDTHAIHLASHCATEGKSRCAQTSPLTKVPRRSFARPGFGLAV